MKRRGKSKGTIVHFPLKAARTSITATIRHVQSGSSGNHLVSESLILEPAQDASTSVEESETKKRYTSSDEPMEIWLPYRDTFLDALLSQDGRGPSAKTAICLSCCCPDVIPVYTCHDCFDVNLTCEACCQSRHKYHPFHRVKKWNGDFFESRTLHSIGVRIRLGHSGAPCSSPKFDDLIILHTNGVHKVFMEFCGCPLAARHYEQLLSHRIFPATVLQPRTCATFALLRHSHLLLLQSKISVQDLYTSLEHETDNEVDHTGSSYKPFLMMIRQWRHLKMLKRGGRGHSSSGASGTRSGELAIVCPACPQPGCNLPSNWAAAANNQEYLYQKILAVDANFRLKNRMRPGHDPGLGTGWSYFVEDELYDSYLKDHETEQDASTCSGLTAVDLANKRNSKGLRATGVGAAICARHGILLPNGIGDLQKGERYANMDFIVFSGLRGTQLKNVLISYDIACQWKKRLKRRHPSLPILLHLDFDKTNVMTVVPKFHLPAHRANCHTAYSLNFRHGVGRTDDDVWGESNYRNVIGIGKALRKKLFDAQDEYTTQAAQFDELTEGVHNSSVRTWTSMILAWEKDDTKPDPYTITRFTKSQAKVRLELLLLDSPDAHSNIQSSNLVSLLTVGLEIEEAQRCLRRDTQSKKDLTTVQSTKLIEHRNALASLLATFRLAQASLMPEYHEQILVAQLDDEVEPEQASLLLPSQVQDPTQKTHPSPVAVMETQLRYAQACDALNDLRQALYIRARLSKFKRDAVRGQRPNTRARTLLESSDKRTAAISERYRAARAAYLNLTGPGPWEKVLQVLNPNDVRTLDAREGDNDPRNPAEGRRILSWIWKSARAEGDEEMNDAFRVEWAKSRARKLRWEEEVHLIKEEMRRVLKFCENHAKEWETKASTCLTSSSYLLEGRRAYALRQADILRRRARTFKTSWTTPQKESATVTKSDNPSQDVGKDVPNGLLSLPSFDD